MQGIVQELIRTLRDARTAIDRVGQRHPKALEDDAVRNELGAMRDSLDRVLDGEA